MNSDGKNTINLSEFENNGELEMTAAFNNNENDQILVSGDVTLSSTTSILKIALKNTRFDEKEFNLIYYGNNLSGEFGEIIYDDRVELGTATINYGSGNNDWISILLRGKGKKTRFSFIDGLSRNQYATAVTYDALSLISEENTDLDDIITAIDSLNNDAEIKEALNQASGYFLANVIRSAALGGDSNEVYNRIHDASQYDFAGSGLWAQAKANSANNKKDETSPGDYNDKIIGMMIGYDRYFAENALMFGFYGKYDMHDIKQEPGNEADIKSFGLGFYGGYIKDKWELKGLLSGNFDSYSTSREITFLPTEDRVAEADFTSTTMGFDLEGAYKVGINDDIDFRPYAGFEIRSVNYDQIKENGAQSLNLTVGSGNYARMSARLGAGINRKHNVYGWYINGEYKQLLNGELPEINNNFEGCDYKFTIVGSEEGKGALGVKAGGSYSVLENLMLYANLSYFVAERYDNIYGGFGVRFMMFGAKDGKRKQIERKDDLVAKRSALKQARRQSKIEIAEDNLKYEEDKLLQLQTSLVDKRRIEKDMQEEAKVAVREAQHAEDIFYSLYEPTSEELAQEEKIVKEKLRQEKDAVKAFSDAEKDSRKIEKYIEKQIKKVEKAKATLAKFQSQEEKVVESEKDLEREAERELKRLAKEEEKIKKEELKLKKTQEKKAAAEEKKIQKQIAAEEAAISDLDKEEAKLAKERAAKEKAAKKELERAEKQLLKEEKLIEKERKRIQKEEARLIAEQEKMLEYEAREKEREIESEKKKPKTAEPVKVEKTKEQLKIEAEIAAYEARLAAEKEKSVQKTTKEAAAEKKKAEEERKRKEQENLKKEKEEAKKQAAKLKEAALDKRAKEAASRRFQKVQKAFNLKFTPDNYKLVETAKITIREQAEEIKKLDYEKIIIEGHTDSEEGGSYEGRKKLSRMRAEEVCNEFIANGIPKEKIDFAGLADKVSIGDNKTDLGKIDNRRVEIVVE